MEPLYISGISGIFTHYLLLRNIDKTNKDLNTSLITGLGGGLFGGLIYSLYNNDPTILMSVISGVVGTFVFDKILLI